MKAKMIAMILGAVSASAQERSRKGKGSREERGEYSHQVRKHNHILKLTRQPNEIQRILIRRNLVRQRRRVVGAQPAPAVRVDADAKVADPGREAGVACDVGHCAVRVVGDLRRVWDGLG